MAMVGKAAPDFAAKAYFKGKAQEAKLSGWRPGKPTLPPETEALARAGHVWEIWKVDNAF
jgi:hypothetical protein